MFAFLAHNNELATPFFDTTSTDYWWPLQVAPLWPAGFNFELPTGDQFNTPQTAYSVVGLDTVFRNSTVLRPVGSGPIVFKSFEEGDFPGVGLVYTKISIAEWTMPICTNRYYFQDFEQLLDVDFNDTTRYKATDGGYFPVLSNPPEPRFRLPIVGITTTPYTLCTEPGIGLYQNGVRKYGHVVGGPDAVEGIEKQDGFGNSYFVPQLHKTLTVEQRYSAKVYILDNGVRTLYEPFSYSKTLKDWIFEFVDDVTFSDLQEGFVDQAPDNWRNQLAAVMFPRYKTVPVGPPLPSYAWMNPREIDFCFPFLDYTPENVVTCNGSTFIVERTLDATQRRDPFGRTWITEITVRIECRLGGAASNTAPGVVSDLMAQATLSGAHGIAQLEPFTLAPSSAEGMACFWPGNNPWSSIGLLPTALYGPTASGEFPVVEAWNNWTFLVNDDGLWPNQTVNVRGVLACANLPPGTKLYVVERGALSGQELTGAFSQTFDQYLEPTFSRIVVPTPNPYCAPNLGGIDCYAVP